MTNVATHSITAASYQRRWRARLPGMWLAAVCLLGAGPVQAQETVCAKVKIEIKQELTLERQAFDAEMKINNTTDSGVIENVQVVVKVSDEAGTPVTVTDDPNNLTAKFFIRVSALQSIAAVDGTGQVNPKTTAQINWLLIPAPGSAGSNPAGKKYLVGATLRYRYNNEDQTLELSPDVITVKPLPLLTLDYFLTQDVQGDDPLTAEIEPVEPFTLGVRVKNNGYAAAKNLKIDSAQPTIVENNQGLLIGFKLTGSYVDDAPVTNTLLIPFGDINAGASKVGRWIMETTLAGKFTEFSASFSHSDELGGSLTSILQATNAHFLIRDVRVDLPGRDAVRDFLAQDGDVIRVYESEGVDTLVTDRSNATTLTSGTNGSGNASYHLVMPPTDGFIYAKLPDPFNGTKALGKVMRSDAKSLAAENVWLSKTRNPQTKQWQYWLNVFDVNTTGVYDTEYIAPPAAAQAPQLQFIPDHTVKEEQQLSFLVEASSPDGKPVTLSAAPLPAGAHLSQQASNPQTPAVAQAIFDWTPPKGSAGTYLVTYTVSDGNLSASRSAAITVQSAEPPPGPGTPTLVSPLPGEPVAALRPTLSVQTSANSNDPTVQVQFELYRDEAMSQLVDQGLVAKSAGTPPPPTTWQPAANLNDNTAYWWRTRGFDGNATYSPWANGRFFVNLFNDAPDAFNATAPAPEAEVSELQPTLSWTNSVDRDGDTITYNVAVYRDSALSDLAASATGLAADASGSTSWTVSVPLVNHSRYYWRATAQDSHGAQTSTFARPFTVNTGNTAPSAPVLQSPAAGSQVASTSATLSIQNSTDAEQDLITYVFELDGVNTFDSGDKRSSGQLIQGGGATTSWTTNGLTENKHYWWRVKAQDGRAESAWVGADFVVNAVNDPPPAPTVKNPGSGAWTASLQPTLEANPVQDPEGQSVSYEFEVYRDSALSQLVAQGAASNPSWTPASPLADKTTHWWRVRALDGEGARSDYSAPAVLYVSSGPYQVPSIAVTAPAVPTQPTLVSDSSGTRKIATLRWEGVDANIEPTVALYWSTSPSGYAGNLIIDGLRQVAGSAVGQYDWDVSAMAVGTYYVYAVIYDAQGVGKAYAPGAVVIAPATQTGSIVVTGNNLVTDEGGRNIPTFTVQLGSAPVADVTLPITSTNFREGLPSPASLVFTPTNWSTAQTVSLRGQDDCMVDGSKSYQVLSGKAVSLDPNYIDLSGTPVAAVNLDTGDSSTNLPDVGICGYVTQSEVQLGNYWIYTFTVKATNVGLGITSLQATLSGLPSTITVTDGQTSAGAIATGETVNLTDTIRIRSSSQLSAPAIMMQNNAQWTVQVQR